MNLRSLNPLLIFSLLMLVLLVTPAESSELKVKVKVDKAKIMLKPTSESAIIAEVLLGAVLDVAGKEGEWFKITFPPDERGFTLSGYIHENRVESPVGRQVTREEVEPTKEKAREKVPQEKPAPVKQPKIRSKLPGEGELKPAKIKNNHIKISTNYFSPSEKSFKEIYGEGVTFGAEVNIKIWKFIDLWLIGNYYSKERSLPFSKEKTKMRLIPIGAGPKFRLKKGALNPYLGFGPVIYLYEEKNPIGTADGTGIGIIGEIGCYFRIISGLLIDASLNYSSCKVKPQNIESDLGGIQVGIGLGYEF